MNGPTVSPHPAPRRTRGVAVALVAIALLVGAAAYVYFAVLRPSPKAHRHLPRGTTIALRADALDLVAFKPIRDKLLPALESAAGKPSDGKSDFVDRLRAQTGVSLRTDLRELVVGSVDGVQWVAALGGTLEAGRFVQGLEAVLKEDGRTGWTREGELLVHALGPAVGQAEDGTLVFGTTASIVRAALPAREDDPSADELPLPTSGALTFMLNSAAYRGALASLPNAFGVLDTASSIDRLNGTFTLSDAPHLDLKLRPKGVAPSELATSLEGKLATAKLALVLAPGELGGAKSAIAAATVRAEGQDVVVSAPWPYRALENDIQQLADFIGIALAQGRALK